MGSDWRTTTLGDVVDLATGFPFESQRYTGEPGDPRLLRGDNVGQGSLRWDGAKRWPAQSTVGLDDYWLRAGDVILAMDRPWIEAGLKYATVLESDLPALLVQRVARLRGTERLDTRFLRYVIAGRDFTDYVTGIQTGTAVPHISGGQIRGYRFPLPPLGEQRRIAGILGALDDKIELNRRMSQTLESMTRALFKSWFVDFDPVRAKSEGRDPGLPRHIADLFPASFEESELGELPIGWRVATLGDIATSPRRPVKPDEIDPATPYIGLEHMPRKSIALAEWGRVESVESSKAAFHRGEILFGKLRPYFHKVGVAPVDGVCSTDIVVVAPKDDAWFGFILGHASSDEFVDYTNATSSGTKMPRTSWSDMVRFPIVEPPAVLAMAFAKQVRPVVDQMISSIHEMRTLATVRDLLLPSLVSGRFSLEQSGCPQRGPDA